MDREMNAPPEWMGDCRGPRLRPRSNRAPRTKLELTACLYSQGWAEGWGTVLWQQQAAPGPAGLCLSPGLGEVGSDVLGSATQAFALVMQFRGNADADFT